VIAKKPRRKPGFLHSGGRSDTAITLPAAMLRCDLIAHRRSHTLRAGESIGRWARPGRDKEVRRTQARNTEVRSAEVAVPTLQHDVQHETHGMKLTPPHRSTKIAVRKKAEEAMSFRSIRAGHRVFAAPRLRFIGIQGQTKEPSSRAIRERGERQSAKTIEADTKGERQ